jgi:hypothetical protein
MKTIIPKFDPRKVAAAQNAQDGLINVSDLSLLTGIPMPQLTKFAKGGLLNHYGEYHGKRFYNFEEVVNWVSEADTDNMAKEAIRNGLETEIRAKTCPYSLEKMKSAGTERVKIVWKEFVPA